MAIVSEKPHIIYEELAKKKRKLEIKRANEVKEDLPIAVLHKFKHKSKKKKSVKEKPEREVQSGGLHMKNKMKGEEFSGKSLVLENYDPDLNASESKKKKDKPKHLKKKKQKNISSELVTQDHEEDQEATNKMSQGISERMPYQFKHKSKKKKFEEKKERPECDEVQAGSLPLKSKVKRGDFSGKLEVPEYYDPEVNALESIKRRDKPKKVKKKKQKNISSELITRDHKEDQGVSTNKMSMVISERERAAAKDLEPVSKKKRKKEKETKRKKEKLCEEEKGKCTSPKETSGRMPVDEAEDSKMKCDKKKSKKTRSGNVMAIGDGVLGTNNQKDASKETRHKKREKHKTDITDETSALKTKKKKNAVVEEEAETEDLDCDSVDMLSTKKGHEELPTDQATKFGQWSTAAFENADQQMKFFRLMGGFKKSSQPASLSPEGKGKANMALDKTGEQRLQQGLQTEFDKAQNLKQHRGAGLGFQPAANKIFYINKNASRSIKFD